MAKRAATIVQDHLGRDIGVGSPVAFYHRGWKTMMTGRITRISRVNVRIEWEMMAGHGVQHRSIFPQQVVLLSEDDYVLHCLRR